MERPDAGDFLASASWAQHWRAFRGLAVAPAASGRRPAAAPPKIVITGPSFLRIPDPARPGPAGASDPARNGARRGMATGWCGAAAGAPRAPDLAPL